MKLYTAATICFLWLVVCYLLVYLLASFIVWDFLPLSEMGPKGRGTFFFAGLCLTGITYWVPLIVIEENL